MRDSERKIQAALLELIMDEIQEQGYDNQAFAGADVDTFEGASVLTQNAGLVLSVGSKEFQITISRSR